jgi:hypothetical protein
MAVHTYLLRELVDGENKFTKVIGELDELRKEYSPIRLNKGKTDEAGKSKEVTVLLRRPEPVQSPLIRESELSNGDLLRRGILIRREGDPSRAAHYITGELVELLAETNGEATE